MECRGIRVVLTPEEILQGAMAGVLRCLESRRDGLQAGDWTDGRVLPSWLDCCQ